jgi:hypothetical protein
VVTSNQNVIAINMTYRMKGFSGFKKSPLEHNEEDSPVKFCKLKHFVGSTFRVKNSLGNQTRLKKKAKKRKIKEERKRKNKNKNTGWSNPRTLPSSGSSKINRYTE